MYLTIDVGGTKTLLALFNDDGKIVKQLKLPTSKDFNQLITDIENTYNEEFKDDSVKAVAIGIPAVIDREKGVGVAFGNLPWTNAPFKEELEKRINLPVLVENDSKLAALAATLSYPEQVEKVLYVTISTGIGIGFITDGKINPYLVDAEAGFMQFPKDGKILPWEKFTSGKVIKERYGKYAKDIDDPQIWQEICEDLALGFINLITLFQPDLILMGGGVGAHLEKYHDTLVKILEERKTPQFQIPPIMKAQNPEEAVIYGCYAYAKQNL